MGTFKLGDSLFKGREKNTGKKYYESTEYNRQFDSITPDSQVIRNINSKACKGAFNVVICSDNDKYIQALKVVLNGLGLFSVFVTRSPRGLLKYTKDRAFNLVLTQYDFHDELDGRTVFNNQNNTVNFKGELTKVCLVTGYTATQFMHLSRSNVEILTCLAQEEGVEKFMDCVESLVLGYYLLFLIEKVYSKEKAQSFRLKNVELDTNIKKLEQKLGKELRK